MSCVQATEDSIAIWWTEFYANKIDTD